jgi:hypothetical protein
VYSLSTVRLVNNLSTITSTRPLAFRTDGPAFQHEGAQTRFTVNVANTRCGANEDGDGEELEGASNLFSHPRCKQVQREAEEWPGAFSDDDAAAGGGPEELDVGEDDAAIRRSLHDDIENPEVGSEDDSDGYGYDSYDREDLEERDQEFEDTDSD